MTEPLVRVVGLEKRFKGADRPALKRLDLSIDGGLVTGLVGPDGAGKTTLMRLLAGLLDPSAGRATVLGHDPTASSALRDRVGYMPQRFGLYEDLSVLENLTLFADLRGIVGAERRATFERLLAFTDLAGFTGRLAGRLSGGMKQKLGLACTLLGKPELLLLDEPGVGVDPVSRRELWSMVHELVADGIAVVWSTAYLDEAEICDRVVLLNEGDVLFVGPPAQLHERVRGRVFLLQGARTPPRLTLKLARRDPSTCDGVVQGHRVRLLAREGARLAPHAHGVDTTAYLESTAPRFEDGFVDLLGGAPPAESALVQAVPARPLDGQIVIETHDLTKRFGDFTAADSVSIEVRRGEVFGLLGPNGAGKSTTFKMLCGLLAPTSGEARVAGVDLRRGRSAARQKLGYMAQKFSLYCNLTVAQNLQFFGGAYALRGKRLRESIARLVEVFDLEPLLKRAASSLPLGHKQRLSLACALLHGPEVLFLDEPTSGVDPLTRREFWTHINGVVERGVTVLVTTHFMDEAEYCDRILLMSRGRTVATGSPDELKRMAATAAQPDPTMEDAFIALVQTNVPPAEAA